MFSGIEYPVSHRNSSEYLEINEPPKRNFWSCLCCCFGQSDEMDFSPDSSILSSRKVSDESEESKATGKVYHQYMNRQGSSIGGSALSLQSDAIERYDVSVDKDPKASLEKKLKRITQIIHGNNVVNPKIKLTKSNRQIQVIIGYKDLSNVNYMESIRISFDELNKIFKSKSNLKEDLTLYFKEVFPDVKIIP